jgi:hypothetical protein
MTRAIAPNAQAVEYGLGAVNEFMLKRALRLLAQTGPSGMSAVLSLSGAKQTFGKLSTQNHGLQASGAPGPARTNPSIFNPAQPRQQHPRKISGQGHPRGSLTD